LRYGIFSDVHGNLEAFKAVLDAYKTEKIDQYLFVGDIVGYGADPKKCISLLKELKPFTVCGNHDWGVAGKTSMDYFNEYAKAAVLWTKEVLDQKEIEYLAGLQLIYQNKDLTLAHGSLDYPEAFAYVLDVYSAKKSMDILETPIGFVGHSHVPFILFSGEDYPLETRKHKVKLEPDKKYLVNVGSVGQPRDFDPRASYCVYDTDEKQVEIKRVEYDIKKAQEKILKARLPRVLAYRLGQGT